MQRVYDPVPAAPRRTRDMVSGVYHVRLRMANPLVVDGKGANWSKIEVDGLPMPRVLRLAPVPSWRGEYGDRKVEPTGPVRVEVVEELTDTGDSLLVDEATPGLDIHENDGKVARYAVTFPTLDAYNKWVRENFATEAQAFPDVIWKAEREANATRGINLGMVSLPVYSGPAKANTRRIARFAESRGHDGVIFRNIRDGGPTVVHGEVSDVYVVFSPSQIKSAAPVARDAQGRVIPLSERFNPDRPDILHEKPAPYGGARSAVTPEQDAAYMRAVESGDRETAQRMVNDAAKKAGVPILDDSASVAYRVRRTAAPQRTVKGYKLFSTKRSKSGELFPLFVGASEAIPQGVWLDAIPGPQAEGRVKSKLGPLAYRPGWHGGDVPLATHIGVKDASGKIHARRDGEVWAEVEFAADRDYQPEADASATRDLRIMPVDGLYRFKTNPNMTGKWIISGSMKVNRVMTESEVNAVLAEQGVTPMPWESGSLDLHKLGLSSTTARNRAKVLDAVTYDDAGRVIPLSERFNPDSDNILHEAPAAYSVRESGVPYGSGSVPPAAVAEESAQYGAADAGLAHETPKVFVQAYEMGAKAKADGYRSQREYFAPMSMSDLEALPLDDPGWTAFFKAGFEGRSMPEYVTGWRYGEIPEAGKSANFRDQQFESGVSLMRLDGEETASGAKIYEAFNRRGKMIHVGGWLVGRGSDGEPLLVGARKIADGASVAPAAYAVRESGVPYGSGSVPPAADGAPDWEAWAALAQKVADLERHTPRRIEITRAIERDRMTRLAREMQRLKRASARAQADKAAGKAAGLDAARKTYETIAGRRADEQATVGDLMREALAIGRQRGRESRTSLDLTRMLREALNARVKRLMGSQLPLPTDWRARNAAVNRRMLGELGQIETSIQQAPAPQRAAAAAAELRRLFGLDKAQWTALETETRMDALGPATLLQAARTAIERDLRAYYRAEMTTLFGGRTVEKRLPNGQKIEITSEGLARRGLRRMVPEQRRAMEALIEGIDFANLKDLPLEALRGHVERAREILAEDELMKEAIAEGHQIRREAAAEAAAAEIVAARPELDQAETADPRKGGLLQRLGWFTASQRRRALLLSGGDDSGAVGTVLSRNLLAANERQLNLETADLRALDDKIAELGFTRASLLALSYQPREVELADGRTVLMTRGEMMTLYGMTLDEDARAKLVRNGWRPARWRHDAGRTIRGEGEDYDARLAASEAIIGGVVAQLTPAEKALAEWMVIDQSREWARRGNETSRRISGAELFEDRPHITLAGSIDRQAELPNVEDPAFSFRAHMVDRMGLTKERQAHTHPLLVRDMLSVYRQQARDMSVFTAWSLPFRDSISMLSRGPALGAIVSRWGVEAVKTMKETLAHATYQKGHTDNWNALQRWFFARERAAAGFILGLRASSAALNRYGGAITMAAGLAAEGRGRSGDAARFLARVFRPQAGLARLGVRERRAAYDALMADGYLYDRWHRSPYRVFAQMASQRMEIEESERASQNARSLGRQDAWRRFQQWALSGMTKGEIGNGVDMYLTLRSGGMSQADAVREVSRLTRLTQNPSTPLEETTQYSAIRSAGLGFALPFQGQPSVLWDWVKAEHIRARRSGDWRPFRAALSGALSATLFSVALRLLVRRAAKGLMDGDDDDDKALQAEAANTILDLAGELSGAVMPGGDQVAQGLLRPALSYAMSDRSLMAVPPGDSTLLGQIGESARRLGSAGLRLARGDDWSEEQVEKLLMDMHRLVGMTTGLPTGGIEQAARVGFGLAGDPLGRESPDAPGPGPIRRRRLVPPARRRQ